ncbi:MAG: hypothetical protein ACKO0W_07295 [Planctomycetota bacterium]
MTNSPSSAAAIADIIPRYETLRLSLRAALAPLLPSKSGARACARVLDLDKSLGWKVYQISFAEDALSSLAAIPGARGWEIVLERLPRAGAAPGAVATLREAIVAFERHLVDKRLDRRMLSGMVAAAKGGAGESSARQNARVRKDASDATAIIWGVQAFARIESFVVAPSSRGDGLDLAVVSIFDGLERRRDGAPWPLQVAPACPWNGAESKRAESLEGSEGSRLMRTLSSPRIDSGAVETVSGRGALRAMFAGNGSNGGGPLRAVFGEITRDAVSARGWREPPRFELHSRLPAGTSVLEVCVHRSLAQRGSFDGALHASISGVDSSAGSTELPLESRVESFDDGTPDLDAVGDDLNRIHAKALDAAFAAMTASRRDFVVRRVALTYAPAPSALLLTWRDAG